LILGESIGGGPSLFFYQYAEGSSYNKFLEIRNPTDSEVDLSGYAFPNQNNGVDDVESFDYWNSFPEGATIAAGGKYIIAHPDADPAIVAVADHLHKYLSNGDDAYALAKGSSEDYVVIDVIGDINGADPAVAGKWPVFLVEQRIIPWFASPRSAEAILTGQHLPGAILRILNGSSWTRTFGNLGKASRRSVW
jgi:hypothetical protein